MAYVVPAPGAEIDLAELIIAHCAEHMAYYMVPRYLDVHRRAAQDAEREDREVQARRVRAGAAVGELWDREKAGVAVRRS